MGRQHLKLVELDDDHDDHDEGDELSDTKADGTRRLAYNVDGVDKSVCKTGQSKQAEKHESHYDVRVCQDEDDSGYQENWDIL